ncbi:MAG: hypothetical protein MJ102_07535 [Clostridia bacterium]|nr:hypothetical protein [Clostridia bacterium]MCQ2354932.1 hypothetical protein [Clostridia bacterium]
MKKSYQKPEIVFNNFELSESIAAGCEFISNHEYMKCALDDPAFFSIFADVGVCRYYVADGTDGICYHAPSDSSNVFTS